MLYVNLKRLKHKNYVLSQNQTVRRPSELERPDVISLRDILSRLDSNFSRRNLAHTDEDNANHANVRIISLNEDQAMGRYFSEVRLGEFEKRRIRISEALEIVC